MTATTSSRRAPGTSKEPMSSSTSGRPHTAYARSRLDQASRVRSPGAMRGVVTSRTTRAVTAARVAGLLRGGRRGGSRVGSRLDPVGRLLTDREVDRSLVGLHDRAVLGVDR